MNMFTRKIAKFASEDGFTFNFDKLFTTNFWQKRHVLLDERIMFNLDKQFIGRRIEYIYQFGGFELISSGD